MKRPKAGMSSEARSRHLSSWLGTTSVDGVERLGIRRSRHCARLPVVSHTGLYLGIMLSVLLWDVNPSMYLRRQTDDGFGCGMGLALTVSTGVKMGIRGPLLRRHHPQRVRLQWSTRFGVGSTK